MDSAFLKALAAGLTDDQLIFDPVLPNLTWPDAWPQVGEVVKAVRLLHGGELWGGPARTMAGLSNLRSGLRHTYPLRVEEAALGVLAGAGLQVALVDVLQPFLRDTVNLNQADELRIAIDTRREVCGILSQEACLGEF